MLRIPYKLRHRNMSKAQGPGPGPKHGPFGRITKLREIVTNLVRNERIEGNAQYMDEARGYMERLVQIAHKNGPQHEHTMKMADYWLLEKDLVHKLFKVLVPRYENCLGCCTSFFRLPYVYPGTHKPFAILELKDNPYPPVLPHKQVISGTLLNVLLKEASKDYRDEKMAQKQLAQVVGRTVSEEPDSRYSLG